MVDRISGLPDEVLCHILSFLRTQEAVATSVLSKRWRPLWTSVPALDFDYDICLRNGQSSFERIVYATILARDLLQPIRRFRLKYEASDYERSIADVNVWVNIAIQRGIENLDIDTFPQNHIISLSCCIFSCRSLVVLKLTGLSLNASSSVDLPSLKTLHLEYVRFAKPKYLMELLYGCPMLEDLRLRCIVYALEYDGSFCEEGFKKLHLPKLVRAYLRLVGMVDTNILLEAICNAEFLTIEQSGVTVIPEFPHLRHLSFRLNNQSWHSVLLMLKNCPKLQSFKLHGSFVAEDVLPDPPFAVPECLTSHLKVCYLKYYPGTASDLQFAKYIIQNSTSLQSMKVNCVSLNSLAKLEVLKELAFCSRKSTSCELTFV